MHTEGRGGIYIFPFQYLAYFGRFLEIAFPSLNWCSCLLSPLPDESELLDKMPLVMRTAIAVDINLTTFQKIALFQVTK